MIYKKAWTYCALTLIIQVNTIVVYRSSTVYTIVCIIVVQYTHTNDKIVFNMYALTLIIRDNRRLSMELSRVKVNGPPHPREYS